MRHTLIAMIALTACAAPRLADLPTALEVDAAVAEAFGPPQGEIDKYLDFTAVSMCMRLDKMNGRAMGAALPSLFRWQERGRDAPLRVRNWELRLLSPLGERPRGSVCVYEAECDGGMGSPGFALYVYARPLTPAAR
jgi:hypothetical protein